MNCKLCKTDTNLCNSHIIPEFFYLPMYAKKRKIFEIHSKIDKIYKTHQKGLRECLLCERCETKLSDYETNVSGVYKKIAHNVIIPLSYGKLPFTNLDYKKFKICYLSILWRMSISSIDFCKNFKLDNENEEKLRNFILNDNPGDVNEYGFLGIIPLIGKTFYPDIMLSPTIMKFLNSDVCIVIVGGLLYMFFINLNNESIKATGGFIQKDGSWIVTIDNAEEFIFLDKVLRDLNKKIKTLNNSI